MRYQLLSAALAILAVACGAGEEEELGPPTGSICPSDSTLTFANFGQAFFETHCWECHPSKHTPDLSTLAQIRSLASEIDRAAAAGPNALNDWMPEEGSVAEAERRQLGEWLACGAPE